MADQRGAGWWWRSLRVRAFFVTFAVAILALTLYNRRYDLTQLALIVLPCAGLLGWWLGWRMVRPLERLRSQALAQLQAVAPGEDLELAREDEFGDLAAAFNRLLSELRTRAQDKEAFVADLAHEFKNPVAAIRAAAEAMEDGPSDAARLARLSRIVDQSSRRLDRLVSQFLELARAEAGLRAQEREVIDVGALGRGLLARMEADERFASVTWSCTVDDPSPTLVGVLAGLETMLANLLENAGSFAGSPGQVALDVRTSDDAVVIVVRDDGPGIPPADLPQVFDRFFTKRASGKGTGLGLAMVRAIAEAHGGQASVALPEGGGTEFTARLPMTSG